MFSIGWIEYRFDLGLNRDDNQFEMGQKSIRMMFALGSDDLLFFSDGIVWLL